MYIAKGPFKKAKIYCLVMIGFKESFQIAYGNIPLRFGTLPLSSPGDHVLLQISIGVQPIGVQVGLGVIKCPV